MINRSDPVFWVKWGARSRWLHRDCSRVAISLASYSPERLLEIANKLNRPLSELVLHQARDRELDAFELDELDELDDLE